MVCVSLILEPKEWDDENFILNNSRSIVVEL
jgi:hypothetical protein